MFIRLLLGFSLLIGAMLATHVWWMLGLLVLSMLLMILRGAKTILFVRSFRLLLWLFVPIIIVQGAFSSGTYIQSPVALPFTVEGLHRAFFLCLHMLLIFMSALACFRLLLAMEWLKCLYIVPRLGETITPYLLLLQPLRDKNSALLKAQQATWKTSKQPWLDFPDLCVQSVEAMLCLAHQEADGLWHNWEQRSAALRSAQRVTPLCFMDLCYAIILLLIWSIFWMH